MNKNLKRALATLSLGFALAGVGAGTAHADAAGDGKQKKQTCITDVGGRHEVNDGTIVTTAEGKRYRCDDGSWTGLAGRVALRPDTNPLGGSAWSGRVASHFGGTAAGA